ncbi:MAG: class I SAM-dependent methyltransferase [Polyangiaceae bacterium]
MILKPWLKGKVPPPLRQALRRLQAELRYNRIHEREAARAQREIRRGSAPLRLHVGCGPHRRSGWTNIDLLSEAADYNLDLRRPLPFPDASVEAIYSEHFIEHLEFPGELEVFLKECMRVLCRGGVFEAGLPDVERSLIAYTQKDRAYFENESKRWHPAWCTTFMDNVNFTFRQGGEHKYAYDFQTLARRLADAGFIDIERRPWRETDSPGWEGCLYVTCKRPAAGARAQTNGA